MEEIARRKRKTYSKVEKGTLLEAYNQSNISKKQWCAENSVGLSTLQRWLQEDKQQTNQQDIKSWVPVITVLQKTADTLPIQIGKCTIQVDLHTNMQLFSTVLKVMTDIC